MKILILTALIIITGIIYFAKLDTAPEGALVDEPAFGYSAYSILTTGKDELNNSFPLVFKSYGDHKLPLYVYSLVPVIKIFGLNNFAVRFLSALSILLLIPLTYLLLRLFMKSKKIILLATSFFALSPFAILMSRFGREASMGLLMYAGGITAILYAAKTQKTRLYILSSVLFGLSWYSYLSYRLILILTLPVIIFFLIIYKKSSLKVNLLALIFLLIIIAPAFFGGSFLTGRLNQVGAIAYKGSSLEIFEKRAYCNTNNGGALCRLIANKAGVVGRQLVSGMIDAFSPQYLFLKGDAQLYVLNLDNYGQYFIVLLPFFYIGLVLLGKDGDHSSKFLRYSILLILPLSVLPAVVSGLGQKMRSAPFIYLCIIPVGLGLEWGYLKLKKYNRLKAEFTYPGILLSVLIISLISFQTDFYTFHISKYSVLYDSHIPPLIDYVKQFEGKEPIVFQPFFSDPLMYYAFYTKIPPIEYQTHTKYFPADELGFMHAKSYKNIFVSHLNSDTELQNTLSLPFIYITDKKLSAEQPLYIGHSHNGVHELVYVYEINDIKKINAQARN